MLDLVSHLSHTDILAIELELVSMMEHFDRPLALDECLGALIVEVDFPEYLVLLRCDTESLDDVFA